MVASRNASRSLRSSPAKSRWSIARRPRSARDGRALVHGTGGRTSSTIRPKLAGQPGPLELGHDLRLQVADGVVGAGRVAEVDRERDALVLDVAAVLRQQPVVLAPSPAPSRIASQVLRRLRGQRDLAVAATPRGRGCRRSRPPRSAPAGAPRPAGRPVTQRDQCVAWRPAAPAAPASPAGTRASSGRGDDRRQRAVDVADDRAPSRIARSAAPPGGPGCRPRDLQYPPCRADLGADRASDWWPGSCSGVLRRRRRHRDRARSWSPSRRIRPRPRWPRRWPRSCSPRSPRPARTPRRATSNWADAALIGVPAAAGAVGGAWLHQRARPRRLVLAFSLLPGRWSP